ncbi:DUF5809 family protein [Halorientalis halophila]|uniref:DUF5809 family protein n=1 Tax=Halorientalis halophila TaxID=3108499 RepID=UPI00300AC364
MHTEGVFSPATADEARERYAAVGPAAQTSVREVAKAMDFDGEEYDERVTGAVVETAREAIFASLLSVTVGTDAEFEAWCDDHPDYEREVIGNENVDRVVWHAVPFAETVVAATFQEREDAAVGTLRRQAFGSVYRDVVRGA